ncbi:DUF3566 domain-containing protein [Streptomyces polyrhachis]|uniref:DUF3566 domain-containing protein n=1 Tax=Streptomyces polyrhachis TaxID=1282885 RepID=A0ABW2GD13_9ACTN
MSGATGAGAGRAGAAEGYVPADAAPGEDDGARGPATSGSQGGTVTDSRSAAREGAASPLPPAPVAAPSVPAGPHRPPHAYEPPAGPAPAPASARGAAVGASVRKGAAVRRSRTGARTVPRTRKARLRVAKVDPWSVMKVSFLLSIALGVCTIVAVAVLWMVLDAMGVFSTVGSTIAEAVATEGSEGFDLVSFLSLSRVLSFTGVIAVIDVVLATALATLGAFIYNLSAGFVGGIELTLAEDE